MFKKFLTLFIIINFSSVAFSQNAYEDISKKTGGMVFQVSPEEFKKNPQALPKLITTIVPQATSKIINGKEIKTALLSEAYSIPGEPAHSAVIPVDPSLKSLIIMVRSTSNIPQVSFIAPDNKPFQQDVVNFGMSKVITIKNPATGNWKIQLSGPGKIDYQIKGETTSFIVAIEIQRMQLGHEGLGYFPYYGTTTPGTEEYFSVDISETNPLLKNFQFVTISSDGRILTYANATKVVYGSVFITVNAKLKIPSESFRILIFATDEQGNFYQRMGNYLFQYDLKRRSDVIIN